MVETTTNLDEEGIVAKAPTLLALSLDFDWQQSVNELREEARRVLSAQGEREMASERLEGEMRSRLHDSMFATMLQPSLVQGAQNPQEEFSVQIRAEELRWQAALQVINTLIQLSQPLLWARFQLDLWILFVFSWARITLM